jgi:predicted dehydrogenase
MDRKYSRRDIIKAMASIPVLGFFAQRVHVKFKTDIKPESTAPRDDIAGLGKPIHIPANVLPSEGKHLRIGIIGNGTRGSQTFRALGFADKDWVGRSTRDDGKPSLLLELFYQQDDQNVEIAAVCDTFAPRAEDAAIVCTTPHRAGGAALQDRPVIYPTYREIIADESIDAVLIQTPDHWHARMAIDAARAGKHVYLEKPMCQTAEEALELRKVVEETGIVLQVGHQNRQQASYIKAREVIGRDLIGKISSVETFTNRNSDHGAWIRGIDEHANGSNVNWKEFLGHKAWRELDLDRYFNWQKWFEYGTGPAGNQFTHEYDCINQILDLGIPQRAMAIGGTYYFRDPRDIPDVFNVVFEYPDRGLSLTYDCTLKNSKLRNKTFLGNRGTMEVNVGLALYPDSRGENGETMDTDLPFFTYHPSSTAAVDAVTSATTKYYEDRGFGYSYDNGRRVDATYLHVKEWLHCIRTGQEPSCNVQKGFEETVTFDMANRSYLEKRMVEWNPEKLEIV